MLGSLPEFFLLLLANRAHFKEFAADRACEWQDSSGRVAPEAARASFGSFQWSMDSCLDASIDKFVQTLLSRVLKASTLQNAGFDVTMLGKLRHLTTTPCMNLRAQHPSVSKIWRPCTARCSAEIDVVEQGSAAGSQHGRRAALSGCLGALVALVGPRPAVVRAEVDGGADVKERVIERIYSFEPGRSWTEKGDDPSPAFREYDSDWQNPGCTGGTYGEITRQGVEILAAKLGLKDKPMKTFYDLGSGAGRAVLHMCTAGYVRGHCRGIELSQARHDAAGELQAEVVRVAGDGPLGNKLKGMVSFEQGDLREKDFSDASLIWTANLCFPESVNRAIAQKILAQPELEAVAAIEPLPGLEDAGFKLSRIRLPQTFLVVTVHLYRRRNE